MSAQHFISLTAGGIKKKLNAPHNKNDLLAVCNFSMSEKKAAQN